jgi:hypothetical protein
MRFLLAAGVLFGADLLLAVLVPPRQATAGTALRLDLPALVRRSDLIVETRVLGAQPLEIEGLLLTEYLLEVSRTFRGVHEPYRFLRLPGGLRADGSGLLVPGVPHLLPGEEALLFLGAEGREGMRVPTGLAQGKLGLRTGADGTKRLVRDARSTGLVDESHGGRGARGERALVDYAEVVAVIEAAAAGATR